MSAQILQFPSQGGFAQRMHQGPAVDKLTVLIADLLVDEPITTLADYLSRIKPTPTHIGGYLPQGE